MVVISVDPPETSAKWAAEKGFSFRLLADPEMRVIDAWGVRNVDVEELSLHAAFIVGADKTIRYRKVARRRVAPEELLHALDGDGVICCPGGCSNDAPVCRPKPE